MQEPDEKKHAFDSVWDALAWWITLTVSVVALPILAITISLASHSGGFGQVIIFILTCWTCTFLGMRLMQSTNEMEKKKKSD